MSFYFIFAGHGDVDEGRGFLELKDAAFTSDDLEQALRRMPSSRTHVILDSCNSFFVINPRKPGGKRFATAKDVMEGLVRRMPTVGVFLSTSAEAEVYEWSELQSGIFSHTVRSGLAGAADADGDGRISYAELSGFVELATRDIRNPLFRPKVFARGPAGDNQRALLELDSARAVLLEAGGAEPVRLTVRDADEGRWLDTNVEAGSHVSLRLPLSRIQGMSVEQPTKLGGRRASLGVDTGAVALASLAPWYATEQSRGPAELLTALFSTPFGPRALAALEQERATQPEPVYGISQEDVSRMRMLLGTLSDIQRGERIMGAAVGLMAGGMSVGTGLMFLKMPPLPGLESTVIPGMLRGLGWTVTGLGSFSMVAGTITLFGRSEGEKLAHQFQEQITSPGYDPAQLVAQTEAHLQVLLEREQQSRRYLRFAGWASLGMSASYLVTAGLTWKREWMADDWSYKFVLGATAGLYLVTSASMLVSAYFSKSPVEHVIRIWQNDPSIKKLPRVSVSPVPGGGMISLHGEF